ncbi:Alpha/Beta hydrolase protein [Xylariales sp. PMI_506]|nr:Alpha/Beta hydrolase protein [Xylariales sp. PMI_506]
MSLTGLCADCFKGTLRGDAVLTGTEERIHGLEAYVARPEDGVDPKGIVVIIPDAYGWKLKNTRAMADNYAKRAQVLVYLPDFMNGSGVDSSLGVLLDNFNAPSQSWYTTLVQKPYWMVQFVCGLIPFGIFARESVAKPRIVKFFQDLRATPPPFSTPRLKIGVAGFCWGGYYTVYLAKDETQIRILPLGSSEAQALIDCAFTGHPSLLTIPRDIEQIKIPISVANGPDDEWMGREKMAILTKILQEKDDNAHEVIIYDGAKHGFVTRGSTKDPKQAELGARAEDQAVNWFKKHLN